MNRPYLFLAGEWAVTMPLVFSDNDWSHTNIARRLVTNPDGTLARAGITESLSGFVFFASVESLLIRRQNLLTLARSNVACWPNPGKLLRLDDRFTVLKECIAAGFVDHPVEFVVLPEQASQVTLKPPFVVKVGNLHQGQGKHLVNPGETMPEDLVGMASVEPFFKGQSWRVLFVGKDEFVLHFTNDQSWVKNSEGADVESWPVDYFTGFTPMVQHARKVRDYFDLEMCGIDYVVDENNVPHFLEYNCFPGIASSDEIAASAKKLFRQKMNVVMDDARYVLNK